MSIGFPKRSKQSRKRARKRAERAARVRPPPPSPPVREPAPVSPVQDVFGGDPVLGAVLAALHRIRARKAEEAERGQR